MAVRLREIRSERPRRPRAVAYQSRHRSMCRLRPVLICSADVASAACRLYAVDELRGVPSARGSVSVSAPSLVPHDAVRLEHFDQAPGRQIRCGMVAGVVVSECTGQKSCGSTARLVVNLRAPNDRAPRAMLRDTDTAWEL